MSYIARDVNGYLGDVASLGGWATFVQWARTQPKLLMLAVLLRDGWAPAAGLVADLSAGVAPGDADSTRKELLALAQRAEDVLIVTDGVGDADEGAST
jgi:hypothetical protein